MINFTASVWLIDMRSRYRQTDGKSAEPSPESLQDDNYIAVRDVDTGEYMMNGGFVVSMFQKSIQWDFK